VARRRRGPRRRLNLYPAILLGSFQVLDDVEGATSHAISGLFGKHSVASELLKTGDAASAQQQPSIIVFSGSQVSRCSYAMQAARMAYEACSPSGTHSLAVVIRGPAQGHRLEVEHGAGLCCILAGAPLCIWQGTRGPCLQL
jgi:hypothetical protein